MDTPNLQNNPSLLLEAKTPHKSDPYLESICKRSEVILADGYGEREILSVVMGDIKAMGGPQSLMQMAVTGKLTKEQFEICERLAVKMLALCSIQHRKLNQ